MFNKLTGRYIYFTDSLITCLYYILYELGIDQEAQQKLYEELAAHLRPDEEINEEHLEQLKYLKNVVKETLR